MAHRAHDAEQRGTRFSVDDAIEHDGQVAQARGRNQRDSAFDAQHAFAQDYKSLPRDAKMLTSDEMAEIADAFLEQRSAPLGKRPWQEQYQADYEKSPSGQDKSSRDRTSGSTDAKEEH